MEDAPDRAALEASAARFQQAVDDSPYFTQGWVILGELREQLGDKEAAIAAYRRARDLDPTDTFGAVLRLGRLGVEEHAVMPEVFVRSMFDQYAARFEAALVDGLSYRGPALLREAIERVCASAGNAARFDMVLDLGCGTGLAGVEFRPLATVMTGIDLAPQMLAVARAKGLYDRLEAAEIVRFLDAAALAGTRYDLILAADVLPYFDDLRPVTAACARLLNAGALFAFTVEVFDGDGVKLGEKLRFTHGARHISEAASGADLVMLELSETTTRTEDGHPVPGFLAVMRHA